MEGLELLRIRAKESPFSQYIPGSFRELPERENGVCVGAVYGGAACAAAVAEIAGGECRLRYVYVDPQARLCGLGSYLLEGLVGQAKEEGAHIVKAVYSPSMLENGAQTLGILERAGFGSSKPVSTAFSVRLGDIAFPDSALPEGTEVFDALELPEELIDQYTQAVDAGVIPPYADVRRAEGAAPEICFFAAIGGELASMLIAGEKDGGLFVHGVYVLERFRREKAASAVIAGALAAAKKMYPPETEVGTSSITSASMEMCYKLFGRENILLKETELMAVHEL